MRDGEAHVWLIELNRHPSELEDLHRTLTADERERARRFHFEVHRNRYIAGRGLLRKLLSGYVNIPAGALRFEYAEFGKPALAEGCGGKSIRFNLSHSNDLALLAVTSTGEVGVDIEVIDPAVDWNTIGGIAFSLSEMHGLRTMAAECRAEQFYSIWTRKEAYLKALGCGLSEPTSAFSVWPTVTIEPRWRIHQLDLDRRSCSALVIDGEIVAMRNFTERSGL